MGADKTTLLADTGHRLWDKLQHLFKGPACSHFGGASVSQALSMTKVRNVSMSLKD